MSVPAILETVKHHWRKTPSAIRKPIVLTLGVLLIVAAGLTGWLPGPGGIPLFLLGIAVLATEFEWAKTVRDAILGWVKAAGRYFRRNPVMTGVVIALALLGMIGIAVAANRYVTTIWQ